MYMGGSNIFPGQTSHNLFHVNLSRMTNMLGDSNIFPGQTSHNLFHVNLSRMTNMLCRHTYKSKIT